MLRSSFLLTLAVTLGCSTPRAPGDPGAALTSDAGALANAEDAGTVSVATNVVLYVPPPLSVRPGQAVRMEGDAGDDGKPVFLDATCITGSATSALDVRRHSGSDNLGGVSDVGGLAMLEDGTFGGVSRNWVLDVPTTDATAARFLADVAFVPTRIDGSVHAKMTHNSFWLRDEHRERSGPECGTHFVRSVRASRFLTYSVAIDFPSIASARGFLDRGGSPNVIVEPKPALVTMLKERGARITLRVFASRAVANVLAPKLANVDCRVDHIEGCGAAHKIIFEMLNLGSVQGNDDTLESVLTDDAGWNIYDVRIASGEIVR